jgi:hypothetical protein
VKRAFHSRFLASPLALAIVLLPDVASACAACYGQSDDPMARGMNMGIFTLLIVVVGVLSGIAGVGIFFAVRSARLAKAGISPTEPAGNTLSHSP